MLNYQKLHYDAYFIVDKDGVSIPCSRSECFAAAEPPTRDNPWKQRWYYDPEKSVAIRLARTEENEAIHRLNQASLKRGERHESKMTSCVWTGTSNCDQDCSRCQRRNTRFIVELDKEWDHPDGTSEIRTKFELAGDDDLEEMIADVMLYRELYAALEELEPDQLDLILTLDFEGRTQRDYAAELGISHQAVNKRRQKAIQNLRTLMGVEK